MKYQGFKGLRQDYETALLSEGAWGGLRLAIILRLDQLMGDLYLKRTGQTPGPAHQIPVMPEPVWLMKPWRDFVPSSHLSR